MSDAFIIILLILLNGFFALAEISLITVRKSQLSDSEKKGNKSARVALNLAKHPNEFLSTVQIGITLIGIMTGIYSGNVIADDFASVISSWGIKPSLASNISQITIVIIVTYLTLIFGELVPKRIGMSVADRTSTLVARPMYLLSLITKPFVWILAKSTSIIFNLLGLKEKGSRVTESEIKSLIAEGANDGEVQKVEQDIVDRVFLMGDLKIGAIMTHHSEIDTLDIDMTTSEIRTLMMENTHVVYPVMDKTNDTILGVVLLKNVIFNLCNSDFNLKDYITEGVYFHENMSVYKALEKMKELKISSALVCDEFGSWQGIVTLKDILEGFVGSIGNDNQEADIIKRANTDEWLVDGQCPIHYFLSYFDIEDLHDPSNDYTTVGGLVLDELQHIPKTGESVSWNGFTFEIVDMDGVRIDKIAVSRNVKK